jgi:hypothetical protein
MGSQLKYLKFGRYLLGKKIITERDIRTARFIQKKNNHMIGDLARAKGWLNDDDIHKILIIQEDTFENFGDIAIREKFLTNE